MISPPAPRPNASPDTAKRAMAVEVRYSDGTIKGYCSQAEADGVLAAGLGEWRGGHRAHVRLMSKVSDNHHGGRRTWYGPSRLGRKDGDGGPVRYAHAHGVCEGYARADPK